MKVFKKGKKTILSGTGSAVETVLSVLHAQTKRRQETYTKNSYWEKSMKMMKISIIYP